MKIYYYYDDAFVNMKNMFEQSFKDDFEPCPVHTDSIDPQIINKDMDNFSAIGGGIASWLTKVGIILDAIDSGEPDEIFVMSDIDIVFYKPVLPIINKFMQGVSLCLQRETFDEGGVNIGFMGIRCDQASKNFWKSVRDEIILKRKWDQEVVNNLLTFKFPIKWRMFPVEIWNYTQRKYIPRNMALHHANAAKTTEDKLDQIHRVRRDWRNRYYSPVHYTDYLGTS